MPIQAIIFDWAGTTIDYGSQAPIYAFQKAFAKMRIQLPTDLIRQDMGLDKYDHIQKIMHMPMIQDEWQACYHVLPTVADCDHLYHLFKEELLASLPDFAILKPGMSRLIDYLNQNQISYGTTTGYDAEMLARVLPVAAAQGYRPQVNITSEQTDGVGRPTAEMLNLAMSKLGVTNPREVIKVGDSINDILEGQNGGVRTAGILDGSNLMGLTEAEFESKKASERAALRTAVARKYEAAGADYLLQTIADLPAVIAHLNRAMATN